MGETAAPFLNDSIHLDESIIYLSGLFSKDGQMEPSHNQPRWAGRLRRHRENVTKGYSYTSKATKTP